MDATDKGLRNSTLLVKAIIDAGMIPGIKVDTGKMDLAGHYEPGMHRGQQADAGLQGRSVPGSCTRRGEANEVAHTPVWSPLRAVAAAFPGIAFLSGGQPDELASARLNANNVRFEGRLPCELTLSFARAIQQSAKEIWRSNEAIVLKAQQTLYHRAGAIRPRHGRCEIPMTEQTRKPRAAAQL